MRNKVTGLLTLLVALAMSIAIAVSAEDEAATVVDPAQQDTDCSRGGALEQSSCFEVQLKALEQEADQLLQQAVQEYKSRWGDEATSQGQQRLKDAHIHWKTYRDLHCRYRYASTALVHSGGDQLSVTVCLLRKTKERLGEIEKTYLKRED